MISASSSLTRVIKFIYEFDESIFCNPLVFSGFIKDLYCGKSYVADDFILILIDLHDKIINSEVSLKDLSDIKLEGINNNERCKIQSEIFKIVYINKNFESIEYLNTDILKVYNISFNPPKESSSNRSSSSIIFFNTSQNSSIEFGKIITLFWKCNNPYRLFLSNGYEDMDVTYVDSILISALFDDYVLILYNKEGEVVDKQNVKIQYKKNAFCINCGTIHFKEDDYFCTQCGLKLTNDAEN